MTAVSTPRSGESAMYSIASSHIGVLLLKDQLIELVILGAEFPITSALESFVNKIMSTTVPSSKRTTKKQATMAAKARMALTAGVITLLSFSNTMKKTKIEVKTSKTYVAVFVWVRSSRNNDNAIRMTGETYLFDAYIS